jgi:hypothetical protein
MILECTKWRRGPRISRIPSSGRCQQRTVHSSHPRHDRTVVKTNDKFHVHRQLAAHALDNTQNVPSVIRKRHSVDDAHGAIGGFELGLQRQRSVAIMPSHLLRFAGRGN